MVPAKKRPARSQAPSFIRLPGMSGSTAASKLRPPVPESMARKPSLAASTSPPGGCPVSHSVCATSPVRRCTRCAGMSVQYSAPAFASQQGPSPSEARGTASSVTSPITAATARSARLLSAAARHPGAGKYRHAVDLDQHPGHREGRAHGGPGRQRPWEYARVNLVHAGEVLHVREEHAAPDHVGQGRAGRLEDGLEVAEGDPGLLLDAGRGQGPVLERALSGHVDEPALRDDPG